MANRPKIFPVFLISLLSVATLKSQNVDLLSKSFSGKLRGMAGAGIAVAEGHAALDLNPAGLSTHNSFSVATSNKYSLYSYSLTTSTVSLHSRAHDWYANLYNFDNLQAIFPLSDRIAVGAEYVRKLTPFVNNEQRAITGSTLFRNTTSGSVYAFAFASGFRVVEGLALGLSVFRLNGTVTSAVQGDNHGHDETKWARLESFVSGTYMTVGMLYDLGRLRTGLVVTPPYRVNVAAGKRLSNDEQYRSLFPSYDQTIWRIPASVALGFGYTIDSKTTVTVDVEANRYEQSDVKLNLYEFGGPPSWKNLFQVRAGIESFPFSTIAIPLRLGYCYSPQLYASMDADGRNNGNILEILEYNHTTQNVLQVVTAGTTIKLSEITIHLGAEYAFLRWERNVHGLFVENDEYKEKRLSLTLDVEYILAHE